MSKASTPTGSRVYAIGDIHGRIEPLAELVAAIRRDAAASEGRQNAFTSTRPSLRPTDRQPEPCRCVVVFLGDYVDRGLESREVIDFLQADPLPGFETVFLKGNHEAWLQRFLGDASVGRSWLGAGGQATLLSYGISAPPGPRNARYLESLRSAFGAALPQSHRDFLDSLKTDHVEGDYAFVHAGIRPGIPLAMQDEHDLLWIRDEFTSDHRDHGHIVVHGHCAAPEPVVRDNRVCIDTGAYATGRLTCLVLQGTSRRFLSTGAPTRTAPHQ